MRGERLFRDLDVRGSPSEGMSESFAERLGRALGTLARRSESGAGFVVGREPSDELARLRDGLVRGLVLSGQPVTDLGVVSAREHEFGMVHLAFPGGVFIAGPDGRDPASAGFELLLGGGPLVGEALKELRDLLALGDLSAGAGTLEIVSVREAYLEAERRGDVPGLGRDTQVI